MCDVPSIAVFFNESIECFPGTASKFFLKLLVTIPVAPIITGIVVYYRFHIRCICIHKLFIIIIIIILTAIELLLGGTSPYTRTNIHKRNDTKNTEQTTQNTASTSTHQVKVSALG